MKDYYKKFMLIYVLLLTINDILSRKFIWKFVSIFKDILAIIINIYIFNTFILILVDY